MATLCRTFHHDIISWWKNHPSLVRAGARGVHAHPISLYLPSHTELWCICSSWESIYTPPISTLPLYVLCGIGNKSCLCVGTDETAGGGALLPVPHCSGLWQVSLWWLWLANANVATVQGTISAFFDTADLRGGRRSSVQKSTSKKNRLQFINEKDLQENSWSHKKLYKFFKVKKSKKLPGSYIIKSSLVLWRVPPYTLFGKKWILVTYA